ncbi:AAC(3) family N-acetyltransferase [Streptomyces avermitilis]
MSAPPPTGPLVTRNPVATQLLALGVRPGETLLAHSSLRALGWVPCPSSGGGPSGPRCPRTTRGSPIGPGAAAVLDGHAPDCRLGERSPPTGLAEPGARVLLLGAGYDTCTSFHLAEYRIPSPLVEVAGRPPGAAGKWSPRWRSARSGSTSWAMTSNGTVPVVRGTVGAADVRLFPVAEAVAYACSPWRTRWRTRNGGRHCTVRVTRGCGAPPTEAVGRVPRLGAHAE